MEQVDKPDEPEEQPEDIAQPEVVFLEMVNIFHFSRFNLSIPDELKKEVLWGMHLLLLQ
jgi:hypothetical protein